MHDKGDVALDEFEWQWQLQAADIKKRLRELQPRIKELEKAASSSNVRAPTAKTKKLAEESDVDDYLGFELFG